MNKRFLRAAIGAILLVPGLVLALGMGEIEAHSYLNQPLDARIPLKSYDVGDLKELKVSLASEAEFARAGVTYAPVLKHIRFKVVMDPKTKTHYIRVYTLVPISDAYLNFLVELNWPQGRLIREYTLLLDPPDVTTATAPGIEAPAVDEAPADEVPVQQPQAMTPPAAVSRDSQAIVYGPVRINETLWEIAERIQSDHPDASIEQIIMALQRNNPNAFINNNVNNLKAGVILRIDNPDDIRAMSKSQAQREFRRQYQAWLDYKRRRAANTQAQKQTMGQGSGSGEEPGEQGGAGSLKLMPPDGKDKQLGQMEPGDGDKQTRERIAQLQQQLDEAMAEASSGKQENAVLRERLKSLEEQMSALQRVVTVKSDELASLQEQLQHEQQALDARDVAAAAKATSEAVEVEAEQEPAKADEPGMIDAIAKGVQSWYKNPLQVGISGGLLVLLLVLVLLYVRQRRAAGEDIIYNNKLDQNARYKDDIFDEEQLQSWSADQGFDSDMDESLPDDPMAQADIFIAFGKFDEAVALMEEAIENEPDNLALKVKLDDILNLKSKPRVISAEEMAAAAAAAEGDDFESATPSAMEEPGFDLDEDFSAEPMAEMEPEASVSSDFDFTEPATKPAAPELSGFDSMSEHDVEIVPIEDDGEDEFSGFPNYGSDYTKPYEGSLISEEEISNFHRELGPEPAGIALDEAELTAAVEPESATPTATTEEDGLEFNIDDLSFAEGSAIEQTPAINADALDFDLGDLEGLDEDLSSEPAVSLSSDNTLEFDTSDLDSLLESDEDLMLNSTAADADVLDWDTALDTEGTEESEISDDEFAKLQDMVAEDPATKSLAEEEVDIESSLDSAMDLDAGFDLDSELSTALDELEQELEMPDIDLSSDEDVDLLNTVDEVGTKLDLAKAYMDMGDPDGARSILEEVQVEGNSAQKQEAEELLEQLSEMA